MDVTGQLKTLTELLEGESNNPDMVDETSEAEEEDMSGKEGSCFNVRQWIASSYSNMVRGRCSGAYLGHVKMCQYIRDKESHHKTHGVNKGVKASMNVLHIIIQNITI